MKLLNNITPRLLSVIDAGLIIILSSVYAKTAESLRAGSPYEIKVTFAVLYLVPLLVLFLTAVLCFTGRRTGLIFALLMSSIMVVIAILITGGGGFILIFLDGAEAGVNVTLDALYYSSLFMAGGGLLLLFYMLIHIFVLFRTVKITSG